MSNAYDNASLLVTPNGYEAGTIFSAKPTDGSGDLSFSRASTALRRNSAGLLESVANDVPRLNYPVGGGCPSWLFEAQATNYAQNSANISAYSSYLSTINTPISNDLINGQSSYLLYPSSSAALAGQIFMALLSGITDGETITIQAKVKAEGKTWAYLGGITAGFAPLAWFNLSTGVVGTVTAGVTAKISAESNGYYTISVTAVAPVGTLYSVLGSTDSDNTSTNTASGTNGIRVAYIGVEKGLIATSPIITVGSAITRMSDSVDFVYSGFSNSSVTLYIEAQGTGIAGNSDRLIALCDSADAANNFISMSVNASAEWQMQSFGLGATVGFDSNVLTTTHSKMAFVVTPTKMSAFINGVKIGETSGSFTASNLDNVFLLPATARGGNFECDNYILYSTGLSDAEAIALTTL